MEPFLIPVVIFVAVALQYWFGLAVQNEVRDQLREYNIDPSTVSRPWMRSSRYSTRVNFTGVSKLTGETVSGHAIRRQGVTTLNFDHAFDRRMHLRGGELERPTLEPDPTMDLETRIRFETNQRLERLQSDRERFLANDTDGDGVVDADEWAAVTKRVEAEVRAELEGADAPSRAAEHPGREEASEATADDESPELPDGHW